MVSEGSGTTLDGGAGCLGEAMMSVEQPSVDRAHTIRSTPAMTEMMCAMARMNLARAARRYAWACTSFVFMMQLLPFRRDERVSPLKPTA